MSAPRWNLIFQRQNQPIEPEPRPEVRSNYAAISCPQKHINPFSLFKGFMSGTIKEGEQTLFPALSTFNYFKNISEVIYDKNRNTVMAYLENDPIWSTTSWSGMMEAFGNEFQPMMGETSNVIKTFGSGMEELDKFSEKMKVTAVRSDLGSKKQEFDQLRAQLEKTHPCFFIKCIMKRHNPTTLEYNIKFLNLLNYEPSEFASRMLRHGIPEIYPNTQKKYAVMMRALIETLVQGSYDGKPIKKEVYLLHANLQVTRVRETIHLMRSFNQNQELEIEIFHVYEMLPEPMKIEDELKVTFKPSDEIPQNEHEKDEFLKKFYNIKKKDSSDAARTCRIRFL